jgi:transposase
MSREEAARIGGMDRQTLRDWVHRFNAEGPDGLKDIRSKGHPPRLTPEQLAAFAEIVETGPDRAKDGVVRWRPIDLKRVVEALRRRLPRAHDRQAPEADRLLAHQRAAAPSS